MVCLSGISSWPHFAADSVEKVNHKNILIASCISKAIAGIATYPHEVLRTRLQTRTHRDVPKTSRSTLIDTSRTLIQQEGWKSLYRGLGTNLIRTVPSTAVSLWMYEYMKHEFVVMCKDGE